MWRATSEGQEDGCEEVWVLSTSQLNTRGSLSQHHFQLLSSLKAAHFVDDIHSLLSTYV